MFTNIPKMNRLFFISTGYAKELLFRVIFLDLEEEGRRGTEANKAPKNDKFWDGVLREGLQSHSRRTSPETFLFFRTKKDIFDLC